MQKMIKDLIVSSTPIRIQDYLGRVVVTYSDRDEEACAPVFECLKKEQILFSRNPIAYSGNIGPNYMENVHKMIQECACFVLVVSDHLLANENRVAMNILWHQIGQVEAKNVESIRDFNRVHRKDGKVKDSPIFLPVSLEKCSASLAGSPLQDLNVASGVEEMIRTIRLKRFSSKLIRGNFYASDAVERFAESRITYGSFKVNFDITEKSFRTIQAIILRDQQLTIPDQDLDSLIRKSIIGKVHLLGFGSTEKMEPQFKIYEKEMDVADIDYPENFIGSKTYIVHKPEEIRHSGIHAVLTVEFIVPVHKLLGVYFKPFITVAPDENDGYDFHEEEMLELLRPTFTSSKSSDWYKKTEFDTYYDSSANRLYFNLNNDKEKRLKLSPEQHLGEYADFMYPQ